MPSAATAMFPQSPGSRFLKGLTPREVKDLWAAGKPRSFLANSIITNQGNPAEHLFLLTSGRARHFFSTEDGDKTLLLWLTPGDIFGGFTFLSERQDYLLSTETVKDSSVMVWDHSTIRGLATQNPKLVSNVLSIAADYLTWYVADHVALICQPAHERLARVLTLLAKTIGNQTRDGVEFDVTNEELASAANITPFTASRLLSQWQTSKAIAKRRGKLLLRSPDQLLMRSL
jgi:CRP/FNR family transcriptional regulator, nitrogen oxide reductase regulator